MVGWSKALDRLVMALPSQGPPVKLHLYYQLIHNLQVPGTPLS